MNRAQARRLPALADVKKLYLEDLLSSTMIAERYGCHAQSIRHMLRGAGVSIRGKQEAALLGPSEWTDERKKKLKELWHTDKRVEQIRLELGITYTNRSVSRQAAVLGLPPRCEQPKRKHAHREKSCSRISVLATATREARLYRHETLISFPESATLEMAWRHELAKVRQERGAVQQ